MLTRLKLEALRALKPCVLTGLGRVNVVCGKNNSGKSTLLEAISTTKTRRLVATLDADDVERLYDATAAAMGFRGTDFESAHYKNVVRAALAHPVDVQGGSEEDFTEHLRRAYAVSPVARYAFNEHAVSSWVRSITEDKLRVVLVPPKRTLEPTAGINTNSGVDPSGLGLLNLLFYAKCQPDGSAERVLFDRLSAVFEEITGGYRFDIFTGKDNTLVLRFRHRGGAWVDAPACGLGLHDVLVLLYAALAPGCDLLLIEEPESHLHPDMQRRLLAFFRTCTDRQFVLSTHSNVFLNNAFVDKVLFTIMRDGIEISDETSRASMLDDLGYSVVDNLVSDVVVLVEGPSDVPVLEEFLIKMGALARYEIKFWPLGGDIMAQVDLDVLAQRYKVLALIDRDPKSTRVRNAFEQRCEESGVEVHRLERVAIENYFTLGALKMVFGGQVDDTLQLVSDKPLEAQLGFNVKKNNRKVARAMALADIEGTDLHAFLRRVVEACEEGAGAASGAKATAQP